MSRADDFCPLPLLSGGHIQTLAGHFARRGLRWSYPVEDIVVSTDDDVRILLRASWQPGPQPNAPALVLVHGLEGSDTSGYILSTALMAYARGWHVIRMNMRGCGDSLPLCPLLYNAGLSGDLLAVLEGLGRRIERLAVAGFSLGANLLLVTLARGRQVLPPGIVAAAAVCPPLDLDASAHAIDHPSNRLYQRYFLRRLKASYRLRQSRRPDLYQAGVEAHCDSIREYDDAITARYGGYQGAEDYYARVSSGPELARVNRPTLVLASADDPLIPVKRATEWQRSPSVELQITETGGHVGYLGKSQAPARFWAAERALSFLERMTSHGKGSSPGLTLAAPYSPR